MKLQRGTSLFRRIVWNTLVLLALLDVTDAGPAPRAPATGLSLTPVEPTACETLTVGWYLMEAPSFSIQIVDNFNDQGPLFHTTVPTPTSAVEWLVNATNGASLHLVIFAPGLVSPKWGPYLDTDLEVLPGSGSCAASVASHPTTPPPNPVATSSSVTTLNASGASKIPPTATAVGTTPATQTGHLPQALTTSTPSATGTSTSTLSASQSHLSTSAIAGLSLGMSLVGTFVAIGLIMYVKQLRNHRRPARAEPFIGRRRLRDSDRSIGVSSLDMDSDGDSDQSPPAVYEEVEHARVNSSRSLVAQVSSVESSTPDALAPVSRPQRASVDRLATSEKLFRERRNRTVAVSTSDGVHERTDTTVEVTRPISSGRGIESGRGPRHETDAGVRLAGGRAGQVIVDDSDRHSAMTSLVSTLPPPYSSHFGET